MTVSSFTSAPRRLEVSVASGDGLDVRTFQVVERMNELFEISIDALCENPDIDFEAVVGQPMTFTTRKGVGWAQECGRARQSALRYRAICRRD
jgi:type VI secretion system secreted protein VgrG